MRPDHKIKVENLPEARRIAAANAGTPAGPQNGCILRQFANKPVCRINLILWVGVLRLFFLGSTARRVESLVEIGLAREDGLQRRGQFAHGLRLCHYALGS